MRMTTLTTPTLLIILILWMSLDCRADGIPETQKILQLAIEIGITLPNDDEKEAPDIKSFNQDIRSSQARALQDIAETQARAGDIAGALQTTALIENDLIDLWKDQAFYAIAKAQAAAGAVNGARETAWDNIKNPSWQGTAFREVAKAQLKAGDVEGALKILDYGHGKGFALLSLAILQDEVGDARGALRTFQQASSVATIGGNLDAFNRQGNEGHLVTFQTHAGDIPAALETAAKIKQEHRVFYLCAIAEAQAKDGDMAAARTTMQQALQIAQKIAEREYSLSIVVNSQARIGDIKDALQTAAPLRTHKDRALVSIATAQAQRGDMHGALQTVSLLKPKSRPSVMWVLAKAQAEGGDIHGALQTAISLKEEGWKVDALIVIANAQPRSEFMTQALKYANTIKNVHPKASAVQALAAAQTRAGGEKEALRWAEKQESPLIKVRALLGVANGLLDRRGLGGAEASTPKT